MLLSTLPGQAPTLLSGFGATPTTSEPLKKLQLALVALSDATHNPAIKPTNVTGTLTNGLPDDRTMAAIAASLGLITPHIPKWAAVPLVIAFGVGAATDTAKHAVLDYADDLRTAVIAATVSAPFYTKPPTQSTSSSSSADIPQIFQTSGPWYKTWWGAGAIAVGVLGTLALVVSHRRSTAPAPSAA